MSAASGLADRRALEIFNIANPVQVSDWTGSYRFHELLSISEIMNEEVNEGKE